MGWLKIIAQLLVQIVPLFVAHFGSLREEKRIKQQMDNEILSETVGAYGKAYADDIVPYDGNRDAIIDWVRNHNKKQS